MKDADARRLIRPLRSRLKRLLQELVRTNSVAVLAGGNETPAQRMLRGFFVEQGMRAELYDTAFILDSSFPQVRRQKPYAGRKNLSVRLRGSGRGRSLLLNGHMDTVPPGNGAWTRSAWSGDFRKGQVHGLGSFDMKGGVVANAAVVAAIHAAGIRLGGDLLFESVIDEEWGGGGGTIAARQRGDTADACVIPEGTQLEIYRATRGGFVVDLIVDAGDPSGYFSDAEVVSPALPLGRLLGWVERVAKQRKKVKAQGAYRRFADPVPVQVLAVEANRLDPQVPLSVPSRGTVRVYLQFLPQEDVDRVILDLKKDLEAFAAADPFFRKYPVQWRPLIGGPLYGHEVAADHPWLRCMEASAAGVLGKPAVTTAAPYPCDAGLIHRDFGIPTLLFGPCGAGAHNPDEYVDFESVVQTAEVLLTAALAWTNT
ncbi:MAG TPA: M20/M25/M40 family metallo-hydrolase [Acidobacteriaceae bacterium]|jgi:acetylornithine deacetylase|nr:M20/M25/M40 family metallo-hydrolase [Acidobacteriaceae bacterium]